MKKKTAFHMILLVSALGLASCNDQYLDLLPPSDLTEANFYKTANDMNSAVIGIYSSYQARIPRDWILLEMPSDELYPTGYHNFFGLTDLNSLAFLPDDQHFSDFWKKSYSGIYRANAVLKNIEIPTDYEATQKDQYTGEARFMRALFYFDLVRMFGGIPKVTSLFSVEESKSTPRASEAEIYALITDDLKAAIDMLPPKENMQKGRANKGAATALLVKVYVYLKDWKNAKTYLDKMPDFHYRLMDDFAALWTEQNEDNDEIIFAMKYTAETNGQPLTDDFLPYFGVTGISKHGQENGFPAWSLMKKYEKDDSRKAVTFTEYWKSPDSPEEEPAIWYPYVNKFAVPHTTPGSSGLDIPVLRYADLLLLKAEVLYNLNQPDQALTALNSVRERAFGNTDHDYALSDIPDAEAFYDKLLLERQLELAFENQRWFDLVRTGRYLTVLKQLETSYNPATQTPLVLHLDPKEFQKHFPIPQDQIDLNNPGVLEQNEGYK
ncbi:RagB/SusD family nutrient uptake outer membrane protein [Compostibacter hankyongensis]|uniref:RagB/SusD family nutrient uptake outer membrane protein n=1 Tax=Compostibacter hankyongensis TaxID=1007089 RepID=A0ABP8G9F9_9BACT